MLGNRTPVAPNDEASVRARLRASHVAIVGCGGLGSNAAVMLVRSGIGELTLIDHDAVEPGNLNRQMFFPDQIGELKTTALGSLLRRLQPDLVLHLKPKTADGGNVLELVAGADVVIEAVDGAESKAEIANTLLAAVSGPPVVGASGIAGFGSANEVATEQLADRYYLVGDHFSDVRESLPLLATRVVAASAQQAHMAIRYLLGYDEP